MPADFLLPPRGNQRALPFIQILLADFQDEIEYQFDVFSRRYAEGEHHMAANWRSVVDTGNSDPSHISAERFKQQQERIRLTTEYCAAAEWLRLHESAASLILSVNVEDIDIAHPEVHPLWLRFTEQRHPQWLAQWHELREFAGWDEELSTQQPQMSAFSSATPEPLGANQSPFFDLPQHGFNERYQPLAEEDSLDAEDDEEDEYDGEDEELEEVDERFASAGPDDISPAELEDSNTQPLKAVAPITVPITQLISKSFHPLLHRLIRKICDYFAFDVNVISNVSPNDEAWKSLKVEDLRASLPEEDVETQAALTPVRAQKALLQVFNWAERSGVRDESRIQQEFQDAFISSYAPEVHDFNWHSSGASRIVAGEIEYEGGSEMPNDGFSMQSEARILRPFDRD
jgi:hypothetical protein